ncbi:MAG TPA: AAA family ATPase [Thermoanaerobaculia bacterium]|jgi:exodeoxyribonuclease V alpha subunit|nr:AAA family ATPase [Thermoanaerobaculia bacterium]
MSGEWSPHGVLAGDRDGQPPFPREVVDAAAALDLGPELVHLAWELARLPSPRSATEGRALLLIALAVLAAQRDGSTRLPLSDDGPLRALLASLGANEDDQRAVRTLLDAAAGGEPRLRPLLGSARPDDEGDYRPLLRVGDHLYAQRLWQLERRVVARLRELLAAPFAVDTAAVEAALADLRARPACDRAGRPVPLTDEQEAAVRAALGGRLTAITGGPGTGKTWIVAALLRVVARLGDPPLAEIALAAPTGKAADRLQGSLRAAIAAVGDPGAADAALLASPLAASTLHRLLSYSPTGEYFRRHERNPLGERLVIVDESSMLDLTLAERLLRSLAAGARLVLLGDARQLPSVDAGAVFRDLVAAASGSGRVAVLTRSWRMDPGDPVGSAILAFAEAIAASSSSSAATSPASNARPVPHEDAATLTFRGVEMLLSPPASVTGFLDRWWRHHLDRLPGWRMLITRPWTAHDGAIEAVEIAELTALFAHQESTRLLAPTRGWSGGVGVRALNAWFRGALLRELDLAPPRRGSADADLPLAGEPVLVTRNDYRRNLFNGDHGLVLFVAADGASPAPMAVFRGRSEAFRALPLASLRGHLEPAWASTVHKAQGSEYDAVAVVLPAADTRLLTRELLYTAVTRARRSVTLVGTAERLDQAIARAVERWSGIAESLAPASPLPQAATPAKRSQLALPFPGLT